MLFESGSEINPAMLKEVGLIRDSLKLVKVLGRGNCDKPIIVEASRFSDSARKKIEAAGGTAREVI